MNFAKGHKVLLLWMACVFPGMFVPINHADFASLKSVCCIEDRLEKRYGKIWIQFSLYLCVCHWRTSPPTEGAGRQCIPEYGRLLPVAPENPYLGVYH